ncbi:hypothetical protein B0H63DRAFT_447914 [Podospora didyma]|uniref:Uncharacterized protein n=1 Tax=Podospora didyma TaxID=330526 RepID=A0AAE0NSP6_9PEZI|nr:hypothetical protein B0H63DRAFT_447914 [Podospora didyma]
MASKSSSSPPPPTPDTPPAPPVRAGKAGKKDRKKLVYSHIPLTEEELKRNGRVEGRNLITWTRPRMMEKLVLSIIYESARHGCELPWDAIAHRLHPGASGSAVQQQMQRTRKKLIAEGHVVPPPVQKPGSSVIVDQTIRGYVRAHPNTNDLETIRPVYFDEDIEDRKFNLPDAYENFKPSQGGKRHQVMDESAVPRRRNNVAMKNENLDDDSDDVFAPEAGITNPSIYTKGARCLTRGMAPTNPYNVGDSEDDENESEVIIDPGLPVLPAVSTGVGISDQTGGQTSSQEFNSDETVPVDTILSGSSIIGQKLPVDNVVDGSPLGQQQFLQQQLYQQQLLQQQFFQRQQLLAQQIAAQQSQSVPPQLVQPIPQKPLFQQPIEQQLLKSVPQQPAIEQQQSVPANKAKAAHQPQKPARQAGINLGRAQGPVRVTKATTTTTAGRQHQNQAMVKNMIHALGNGGGAKAVPPPQFMPAPMPPFNNQFAATAMPFADYQQDTAMAMPMPMPPTTFANQQEPYTGFDQAYNPYFDPSFDLYKADDFFFDA